MHSSRPRWHKTAIQHTHTPISVVAPLDSPQSILNLPLVVDDAAVLVMYVHTL